MAEAIEIERCDYCGLEIGEDDEGANSGTCEACWYGMRLDPEGWQARMVAMDRKVVYVGGCLVMNNAIICRNPFEPVIDNG